MLSLSASTKYFRLALGCTTLAYTLLLFGVYTRLSDANPGCQAWSGCYGKPFAPLTAREIYEERRGQTPLPDAVKQNARMNAIYRYLPAILGLFLIRLADLGHKSRKRYRALQFIVPATAAVLAFLQSGLGIVAAGRHPRGPFAMADLILALTILGMLWWATLREQRFWRPVPPHPRIQHLRSRAVVALLLVAAVILLGGWTAANNAGLACPDFPTCQGGWWPPMDFADGFSLWRIVGVNHRGGMLDLSGITAIDVTHRVAALIVLLYVGWLALRTMRVGFDSNLCRYGMLVLVLLLGETVAGVMDVVLRLPLLVEIIHGAIGVLLMLSLIALNHVLRPRQFVAE
ncbi:MAG: COX15/CtaA family protein [Gammaproteobacteria bacterium]|nr:COX15/CtaA family protein [Gammaproteobacteria bacterium]